MKLGKRLLLLGLFCLSPLAMALPGTVNVNTAGAEELAEALDGVGNARAAAIIEYREKFGEFESFDDLLDVSGIGPAVIDANKERIVFVD